MTRVAAMPPIIERQATPIIPIRKNGRPWKEACPAAIARTETLRATRHYGRAFWKRWTGYHVRSRVEAKMRCLKAFGERIAARDPDRQGALALDMVGRLPARDRDDPDCEPSGAKAEGAASARTTCM